MIRIVYAGASKFKYVTQSLAKINDEGFLIFQPDMLAGYVMSPDKNTMAVLKMPVSSFDEFIVDEEINLLVRMDEFNKIVKRATRNDDLILEYDVSLEQLKIALRDRKTGLIRDFYLPAHADESFKLKEPSPEFSASFILTASDFKSLIQDVKVVGDVIELEAKEDKVIARASGEEKEYEWIMELDNPLQSIHVTEESKCEYGRGSLEVAAKPTGASDTVKIMFSTDFPLKAEFYLVNGEKLVIYVAPYV